jgi:hypothetical protein
VAGLAAGGGLVGVDRPVRPEPLELAVTSTATVVVVRTPALALFHHEVAEDLALAVVDKHEIRARRQRLAAFDRLNCLGRRHDVFGDVAALDGSCGAELVDLRELDRLTSAWTCHPTASTATIDRVIRVDVEEWDFHDCLVRIGKGPSHCA